MLSRNFVRFPLNFSSSSKEFYPVLQTMRSSAKIVMWVLLISFVGGFLLFETSGLMGSAPVTTTTAVASVNGRDIL